MSAILSHPAKESAVIGYLLVQGFRGIPSETRPVPEVFTDLIFGTAYAAALELDHWGRPVNPHTIIELLEKNSTYRALVTAGAKEQGRPDWQDAVLTADNSIAYQPTGDSAIELLEDIAEAAARRKSAEIGSKLANAEIEAAEAAEALGAIKRAGREQHDWDSCLIAAEDLCDDKNADVFKDAPVIIEGMLAQGDLSLITAGSKSFKSWLALQIALCTANGIPFLGRQTAATKTLVLNFELKPPSIKNRLRAIAHSLNCGQKNLVTLNLRNRHITPAFLQYLTRTIKERGFGLVILDPLYSMYGVVESDNVENSNPAMTELLSTIRAACEQVGAAVIIVHHHAKGDSSTKASIDRASGAGALGRFPDFVMSLVRHEHPNAYVVEIDFRDFPPCSPFVIRRENSIMVLDHDLDPSSKKKAKLPANTKMSPEEVLGFLPRDGKTIDRATLKDRIAIAKFVVPKTADRHIDRALELKLCKANRYGIYLPQEEVQTRF
jgi:RecA-family ATPase